MGELLSLLRHFKQQLNGKHKIEIECRSALKCNTIKRKFFMLRQKAIHGDVEKYVYDVYYIVIFDAEQK